MEKEQNEGLFTKKNIVSAYASFRVADFLFSQKETLQDIMFLALGGKLHTALEKFVSLMVRLLEHVLSFPEVNALSQSFLGANVIPCYVTLNDSN